ncbi:MAG: DUF5615 family PIN-like protein [Dehalococcoidia bacterium]
MFPVYFDENSQDSLLVSLLRKDGVDCLISNEAGNGELPDDDQLSFAAQSSRAIVTFDRADFQRLHGAWMAANRSHAGILIVTYPWITAVALHASLMRLQRERTPADMRNAILFIGPSPLEERS